MSLPEHVAAQVRATDPLTGAPTGPAFPVSTPAELEAAVQAAVRAGAVYARTPGAGRAEFLRAIAGELEARAEEIVAVARQETALGEARLRGELARTAGQLRLFADVAQEGSWVDARLDRPDPLRRPAAKPDLRSLLVPLGPVAVFGASNFPLAFSVAGGDTASALAAGCPVIAKAHPAHPGTSALAAEAIRAALGRCGLPDGVFSLLYDDGYALGLALVSHPAVRAVGFTGSRSGGLALMAAAQARPVPIPVYAEMSSVNPVVFTESALQAGGEALAASLAASISGSGGQLCTQPGLLFVPQGEAGDAFVVALSGALSGVPAAPLLTPGIGAAYHAGTGRYAQHAEVEPALAVTAGGHPAPGLYQTTVSAFLASPALAEEVFGPVSLVVRYSGTDDLSAAILGLDGQLTASLHARPEELAGLAPLLAAMEDRAGRVVLGGVPTGVEVGYAVVHGGPFPATGDGRSTSVGARALLRFTRLLAYQDFPDAALPAALQAANPLGLLRLIDGQATRAPL